VSGQENETVKDAVRDRYAQIATSAGSSCCGGSSPCTCGPEPMDASETLASRMGYSSEELADIPEGANLNLGCGNPNAIAALRAGETVLDLGSGGGLDCFLAARQVGPSGRVIGVDMTAEMISLARRNAAEGSFDNVEFRLGEIERLPVDDQAVDVILSNCVINLSTDKRQVFQEAFRVLKPGGRLAISDVVANGALPAHIRNDPDLYSACAAGAATISELTELMEQAGFLEITIRPTDESRALIRDWVPGVQIEDYIRSATIEAIRPRA
jgi:arsenite methyltransferase